MLGIRKNDKVVVIAGKDKGRQGDVIAVYPKKGKLKVKGVCIVTRHVKPRKQGETGGITKSEGLVDLSNVMLVCGSCSKATRIGAQTTDSHKVRICKHCEQAV
jgi:large subunit ribosomal protein L24